MKISELSDSDRPREKAIAKGVESLTDAELLAILLGSGTAECNAIDTARTILSHCEGRLSRLSRLGVAEMVREFRGVGPARAVTVKAALVLGARAAAAAAQEPEDALLTNAAAVHRLMAPQLAHLDHEEFHVLLLSRAGRCKAQVCISRGGTAATVVDVKIIMRHALDRLASSIILVHNHPSGTLSPSPQDDSLTRRVADAARLLDIGMPDHVIISSRGYYSYAENGRL